MSPGGMEENWETYAPRLEPDGRNWLVFKKRFIWSLADHEVDHHLNAALVPKPCLPENEDIKPSQIQLKEIAIWRRHENTCRQMLARAIPDSIMWKIINEDTVAEMWKIISQEFESKTALMQADLRQRLHSLKCDENGNVRTHLEHLRMMREE